MTNDLPRWLFDPMIGKLVALVIGIAVVSVLSKIAQRSVTR